MSHSHPIAFKATDIRLLLTGVKTQTRRLLRLNAHGVVVSCPFGTAGSKLWVQETWGFERELSPKDLRYGAPMHLLRYRATDPTPHIAPFGGWRLGYDLPRWASRLVLHVESVRIEPLQQITESDARREGCVTVEEFARVWNLTHKDVIWADCPNVWVVSFKAQVVR